MTADGLQTPARERQEGAATSARAATAAEIDQAFDATGALAGTKLLVEITLVLFEYVRLVAKEHREDRKLARMLEELSMLAREAKIRNENEAIDAGMREAGEKAKNLMDAAAMALAMGCIGGLVQIAGVDSPSPAVPSFTGAIATVTHSVAKYQEMSAEAARLEIEARNRGRQAYNQTMKDAIRKLLCQIEELNRALNL